MLSALRFIFHFDDHRPIDGCALSLSTPVCKIIGLKVTCNGPASHPGWSVILLVTSCWVSCDGLASHLEGSSDTLSHIMLGIL